jgi:hypothetical protein
MGWNSGSLKLHLMIKFFFKSYPSAINPDVVDIEGCSCEIAKGANVTIKEGLTLKIKNEVDVDPKGTLTLKTMQAWFK